MLGALQNYVPRRNNRLQDNISARKGKKHFSFLKPKYTLYLLENFDSTTSKFQDKLNHLRGFLCCRWLEAVVMLATMTTGDLEDVPSDAGQGWILFAGTRASNFDSG